MIEAIFMIFAGICVLGVIGANDNKRLYFYMFAICAAVIVILERFSLLEEMGVY